jgi:hypothetical protein
MNVFRPVNDSVVLPERIMQGKPWRNISFGKNASIAQYAKAGLYLEVAYKPVISKFQEIVKVGEVINHTTKTVTIQWEVIDLPPERVAIIAEQDAKVDENKTGQFANVTMDQAEAWVDSKDFSNPEVVKSTFKKLARALIART